MNAKSTGERAQMIVIGELAKIGANVAIPLSDNLPYDLIIIWKDKLLKCQVKYSNYTTAESSNSIVFDISSNNWYSKTVKKYTADDFDVLLLCSEYGTYIIDKKIFPGRKSISIRMKPCKNNQIKGILMAEDYLLTAERLSNIEYFESRAFH